MNLSFTPTLDRGEAQRRLDRLLVPGSILDAQLEGTRRWAENFTIAKGTPQETAEWAKQGQDLITRWTDTQKQLWGSWFELVKKLDASNMINWPRDGQKFLQSWQETIQKAQAEWVRTTGQASKKS